MNGGGEECVTYESIQLTLSQKVTIGFPSPVVPLFQLVMRTGTSEFTPLHVTKNVTEQAPIT